MSFIAKRLARTKLKKLQLDPFGFCNAKCWYCPVKYRPQPESGSKNMPVDLIEKIFDELVYERNNDGIVDKSFNNFVTANYNEILLYKDYDKMLELARKYGLTTFTLSNGVNLTKDKVDLIKEYRDVITHVGLNIPAFEKDIWSKRAGFDEKQFDRLMNNLEYANDELSYLGDQFQIHVNGVDTRSFDGGVLSKGSEFDSLEIDLDPANGEHERQFQLAKSLFPNLNVMKHGLMGRAGYIPEVLSNDEYLYKKSIGKDVIGCSNWGDRTSEWLHVNSAGDAFICCNDYNFDYVYGNVSKNTIKEVWTSKERIECVTRAFNGICKECTAAVFY